MGTDVLLQSLRQLSDKFDGVAVALSGACLLHCLVLPLAAASMPIFMGAAHAEWVHWIFVAIAIPTSIIALMHDRHSKSVLIILRTLALLGLSLLSFGALGWPSHDLEVSMTVSGGLVLAAVHLVNYFNCKLKTACVPSKAL